MPRTSPSRQHELRDQLVSLFLEEGFSKFTLADLADRLRCSKSTLYALGHSKEQVTVNAVIAFFAGAYLRAVAAALRPASGAFMSDLASHPATAAVYERNTEAAARRVHELIDEGIDAGNYRAVHGAFVADVVAATMRRIQTRALCFATGLGDAAAYDALADLVLNGVHVVLPAEFATDVG